VQDLRRNVEKRCDKFLRSLCAANKIPKAVSLIISSLCFNEIKRMFPLMFQIFLCLKFIRIASRDRIYFRQK
jgi:hypothetical protein